MIEITPVILLNPEEIKMTFINSPGPGGQNVNKVATGVLLRFNVMHSTSLPDDLRQRLIIMLGKRLTVSGDLVIKATRFRTQERNKEDAIERLRQYIIRVATPPKKRKKTKPTFSSKQRRLNKKRIHSIKKNLRRSAEE